MALSLFGRIRTVHAVLFGGDWQGNAQRVRVDEEGAIEVITTVHGHVHAGNLYHASHVFTAVSAAASTYLQILTGATKSIHCAVGVSSSAGGRLRLYEAPTTTTGANTVTVFNSNRGSDNTAEPTVVHTPSGISGGTLLPVGGVVPGGSGFLASGGSDGELIRGPEIILKVSTKYLLQFINDSSSAENISLHLGFYEKTV